MMVGEVAASVAPFCDGLARRDDLACAELLLRVKWRDLEADAEAERWEEGCGRERESRSEMAAELLASSSASHRS